MLSVEPDLNQVALNAVIRAKLHFLEIADVYVTVVDMYLAPGIVVISIYIVWR